jgi:4-amino-4-deoxy-L-arabinose transferase-like glycosyltransferase
VKAASYNYSFPALFTFYFLLFTSSAALALILRLPYAGHLYQDDGLWFAAAEEIVRGNALYRDIYFDKPPALPLLYAGLFELFGPHIITIRLFTIFYSIAIAVVVFLFGSWLYDRRAGLVAASIFTLFSTTYETGHFQGLNTDFLMALPYTVAAYMFARACGDWFGKRAGSSRGLAFGAGLALGFGFQANPKAAFGLVFFAALIVAAARSGKGALLFALSLIGFISGSAPLLIYVAANGATADYWLQVWDWGSRYAGYNSPGKSVATALTQTADYFAINNLLLFGVAIVAAGLIRKRVASKRTGAAKEAAGAGFRADAALLLWLAVSYAGMSVGGRFYGHYFLQILPALCLIAARGLLDLIDWKQARLKRAVALLLIAGLAFTLIRSHGRTAVLAYDWLRGTKSESTLEWAHERLNHEERMVAAVVRHMPGGSASAGSLGLEEMRAGAPADHLFVWGYRPEIYYWSGLLPASIYLSSQPLTGVPADMHYFKSEYRPILDDAITSAARARLVGELEQTRPEFIIDELAVFNSELSMSSFGETREYLNHYRELGIVGRFVVYRRKDLPEMWLSKNGVGGRGSVVSSQ